MIFLRLFWTFFKIGLFSFGGGYVMIPVIQNEIEAHGWIAAREFADIVAISQMTPGPIAVNTATYVGVKTAGFWGATAATLGIALPSFIIIIIIANFMIKFKESQVVSAVLEGIRPATIGLIATAIVFFAEMSIFTTSVPFELLYQWDAALWCLRISEIGIRPGAVAIFLIVLVGIKKFKIHPVMAIVVSAILSLVFI